MTTRLAIDGGAPLNTRPMPPWPHFDEEMIVAATDVLRSGRVSYWTGTECREFECEYAGYTGSRYAIALANGTVSLELALAALGIGPGDEVITTPRTFVGTATAIVARGATPVFADVGPDDQAISAETIERVLSPRTRAIMPVHLAGWPADMDGIMSLAHSHNLTVIEDCAQAHGATWRGRAVGSIGTVGSFSFCQDKILTTGGEGGLVTTDDEDLFRTMWAYKDHGKSYGAVYEREHAPGFRWLVESFGTNWRMTEMQGAIGRVMLQRLDGWVAQRTHLATRLLGRLAEHAALRVPLPPEHVGHAWYKAYAFVHPERLAAGWDRDRVIAAISAEGVPCYAGSCSEIYLEKAFPDHMRPQHRLPVARELGETSLMFLVHPTLDDAYMDATADAVDRVMAVAAG